MKSKRLLQIINANEFDPSKHVSEAGPDLNSLARERDLALRTASVYGRIDIVKLLPDARPLPWSPGVHAVTFGNLDDIRVGIARHDELEARDNFAHIPPLLTIETGDIGKTASKGGTA